MPTYFNLCIVQMGQNIFSMYRFKKFHSLICWHCLLHIVIFIRNCSRGSRWIRQIEAISIVLNSLINMLVYKYFSFRCLDNIQLFPHIKDSTISEAASSEAEVICHQNLFNYILKPLESDLYQYGVDKKQLSENGIAERISLISKHNRTTIVTPRSRFHIEYKQAIYSSGNVLGIRLNYKTVESLANNYFYVRGYFRFLPKCKYQWK